MGIVQTILGTEVVEPAAQTPVWEASNPLYSGMLLSTSLPNIADIYPGVADFCWETWIQPYQWNNQPALIAGWGSGGQSGPAASNFALTMNPDALGGGTGYTSFTVYALGSTSTVIANLPPSSWNTWFHLAMCRIGSTINVYANGNLVSQLTSFTGNLDYPTVGGEGFLTFTGGVGDRDQSYPNPVGCNWRNMRYTIGNSVYPNASTITPPPFATNIAPVTGTQFIFWPTYNTQIGFSYSSYIPDYQAESWPFVYSSGDTSTNAPMSILYAYPQQLALIPYIVDGFGTPGTWTNQGTPPNQPKITTGGPGALFGNSCADFTATGTNVNIISTNTGMGNASQAFLMYLWFYVPANITNEMKSIINVETANGFVLNIGRAGQGLDWVSISAFGGAEQAYAKHIWARNAWNFLCVQKQFQGTAGPLSAWAGANGDNYAVNLNLIDTGGSSFNFASGGNVTIGCPTGSAVSSQMYFNQLTVFTSGETNSAQVGIFDPALPSLPILTLSPFNYNAEQVYFTFQGTNGNTSIQPAYPA